MTKLRVAAGIIAVALALTAGVALSATMLGWSVVGGGGGRASSTNYAVDFTVGQQATGLSASAGIELGAGFWFGAAATACDTTNTDAAPLDNGPLAPGDDITLPRSDTLGDACDADDDNDGVTDDAELVHPVAGCASASAPLDPLKIDTDGDHLTDGWECANGVDPASPASKYLGSGFADADSDQINDLWEQRGYNASPASSDSDGDGCADLVEVASIDGDRAIAIADRLAVARRSLNIWPPHPAQDYVLDIDRNGFVDIADRLFVARAQLLAAWQPKSC